MHVKENITRLREGLAHIHYPDDDELRDIRKRVEAGRKRLEAEDLTTILAYLSAHQEPDRSIYSGDDQIREALKSHDLLKDMYPSLSLECGCEILSSIVEASADRKLPIKLELDYANGMA